MAASEAAYPGGVSAQELKDTEIYAHVNNKTIGKIKSPLDSLQIKGGEDDD
ncbi:MAG: hypothetical protein AEth_00870 [Candidatus Argoarchaeum ethanivorans]|uniref:Uncharacterized protein n=1 Tax=Candidatus Argoarchaeum ethanivorans TaxID=2608793 RepID=A0A8B3S1W6_9EURY|nr:MAG: hypothetical protein AEth_00870 [Candidatus Argoarchaeum ethanivorans]